MRKAVVIFAVAALLPVAALAETWKNAPIVDTNCVARVKADPDKHTTSCALKCEKSGYGLLAADGTYLKFDAAGNARAVAALKATKKTDHLRATVEGDRQGDEILVKSLTLD